MGWGVGGVRKHVFILLSVLMFKGEDYVLAELRRWGRWGEVIKSGQLIFSLLAVLNR